MLFRSRGVVILDGITQVFRITFPRSEEDIHHVISSRHPLTQDRLFTLIAELLILALLQELKAGVTNSTFAAIINPRTGMRAIINPMLAVAHEEIIHGLFDQATLEIITVLQWR